MDGIIAPILAGPAEAPMDAAEVARPHGHRKAVSAPDVADFAGSTGSTGSAALEPADISRPNGATSGTPHRFHRGSAGSGPPIDEPEAASTGHEADPAAPSADPFAELTDADLARTSAIPAGSGEAGDDDVLTMLPCPGTVPGLKYFGLKDGAAPSRMWIYRTAEGAPIVVVARYDVAGPDGSPSKDVRPWTFGRRTWTDRKGNRQDRTGWHCKAPPTPRPLYGLDRLAARPDAPVLVTEGEKTADAASKIFPDWVCITGRTRRRLCG